MKKNPVQIIGHPGCGKTTLMVEIIQELVNRQITVGSIKHSAHSHELDKPGKDSFCHRKAGAVPAAMMTRDMAAIFLPRDQNMSVDDLIRQYFTGTDMVLIEGWISGPHAKIEVYGNGCDRPPLFHQVKNVRAFVTDQPLAPSDAATAQTLHIKIFDRSAIQKLVAYILLAAPSGI